MQATHYYIEKEVKDGNAYYTLNWSPLLKADKYKISTGVPAVAGIYELYELGKDKQLRLLNLSLAWYGGVRSNLRETIDPDATYDPERRKILEDSELYYRYSCSTVFKDLQDVLWFMHTTYFEDDENPPEDSGRYEDIFLNETAPDNFIWNGNES